MLILNLFPKLTITLSQSFTSHSLPPCQTRCHLNLNLTSTVTGRRFPLIVLSTSITPITFTSFQSRPHRTSNTHFTGIRSSLVAWVNFNSTSTHNSPSLHFQLQFTSTQASILTSATVTRNLLSRLHPLKDYVHFDSAFIYITTLTQRRTPIASIDFSRRSCQLGHIQNRECYQLVAYPGLQSLKRGISPGRQSSRLLDMLL
jgi:hypothetical protein